ncbi:hypothetical protein AB0N09_34155 [Streptomyces erythrochromogenes]|uniref:hypothetical protein n=1 Tax=Streptomyces erythrochromogenes TaxID=285574 RepID=UPI0034355892
MNAVASRTPTTSGGDVQDLTLTPLPHWQMMAETVLRKDACGGLCIHACFTRASSVPTRHHSA